MLGEIGVAVPLRVGQIGPIANIAGGARIMMTGCAGIMLTGCAGIVLTGCAGIMLTGCAGMITLGGAGMVVSVGGAGIALTGGEGVVPASRAVLGRAEVVLALGSGWPLFSPLLLLIHYVNIT